MTPDSLFMKIVFFIKDFSIVIIILLFTVYILFNIIKHRTIIKKGKEEEKERQDILREKEAKLREVLLKMEENRRFLIKDLEKLNDDTQETLTSIEKRIQTKNADNTLDFAQKSANPSSEKNDKKEKAPARENPKVNPKETQKGPPKEDDDEKKEKPKQ